MKELLLWKNFEGALLALFLSVGAGPAVAALPAFPGAEGAGALSVGGRGGEVCEVTNLDDAGPGSLRECVMREGPRTVVFRTGGTIELKSAITITKPYLTIAGQTAPGGGIQISGKNIEGWGSDGCSGLTPLVIWSGAHDIIIRYVRIRKGLHNPACRGSPNALQIGQNAHNVIVDHASLYWGHDQILGIVGWSSGPRDVTIQNSVLAEPLEGHAVAVLIHAMSPEGRMSMTNIDLVRNLIANSTHRNPAFGARSGRFVNNIVYNWYSGGGPMIGSGVYYDVIGNLFQPGPIKPKSANQFHVAAYPYKPDADWWSSRSIQESPSIFVVGNKGPLHPDPSADNWQMVKEREGSHGPLVGQLSSEYRRYQPLPKSGAAIAVRSVEDLEEFLLPQVGASKGLDCEGNWVDRRDAQDKRLIEWYLTNRGQIVASEDDVGGFPVLPRGAACRDTSGDGIPDQWLLTHGLDPRRKIGPDVDSSGYTYLELYLSGLGLTGVKKEPPESPGFVRVD